MASEKAETVFEAMIYVEEEASDDYAWDDSYDAMRCDHNNEKDYCSEECRCGHFCGDHSDWNGKCAGKCQCQLFTSRPESRQ